MLILISSLSHFGVPAILGFSNGIFTLPTKIYDDLPGVGKLRRNQARSVLSIYWWQWSVLALCIAAPVLQAGRYDIIREQSMRPYADQRGWKVRCSWSASCFLSSP